MARPIPAPEHVATSWTQPTDDSGFTFDRRTATQNPERIDDRDFRTLDEGLTAGGVIVRQKGAGQGRDQAEVNSLEIENKSGKWETESRS